MNISHIFKGAAALLMATSLAGCFDVDMEIAVLDDNTARATIESTVSSELISLADIEAGDAEFCSDDGEVTVNEADETITCVEVKEGSFEEVLDGASDGASEPTITTIAPGKVKVTFPTSTMAKEITGDDAEEMDEQTKAMMAQMFAGHAITMRVSGPKIAETNMTLSADQKSAELVVPFTSLVDGSLDLPEDAYAIVQLP